MTWLKVEIPKSADGAKATDIMSEGRKWCADNLSSNGVLWKHTFGPEWKTFYFAQPGDLIMFRLSLGV